MPPLKIILVPKKKKLVLIVGPRFIYLILIICFVHLDWVLSGIVLFELKSI